MGNKAHTLDDLRQYQAMPLSLKILMSKNRIRKWVNEYGKDDVKVMMTFSPESTVLLHMVNSEYPDIGVAFDYSEGMKPITSWMASEDENGLNDWLEFGCNHYDTERPESTPMVFWTKENIFEYLRENA